MKNSFKNKFTSFNWKSTSKILATGIIIFPTIKPLITIGVHLLPLAQEIKQEERLMSYEHDKPVFKFIKQSFGKTGVKISKKDILITPKDSPHHRYFGVISRDSIIINEKDYETIKKHSLTADPTIKKQLEECDAILQHEASHWKHHDSLRKMLIRITIPFTTLGLSVLMRKKHAGYNNYYKNNIFEHVFGQLIINHSFQQYCFRKIEQRADDEIPDDIETLETFKTVLSRNNVDVSDVDARLESIIHFFMSDHPTPTERCNQLQQRINMLKQKNNSINENQITVKEQARIK